MIDEDPGSKKTLGSVSVTCSDDTITLWDKEAEAWTFLSFLQRAFSCPQRGSVAHTFRATESGSLLARVRD